MARIVVTGGAGFVGSHLCERLVGRGDDVVCVDDLSSSDGSNVEGLRGSPRFAFVVGDVSEGLAVDGPVDAVAHLASAASPPDYLARPLQTLAAGSRGTEACLALAARTGARFVLASTSEVYGDPAVHPQREDYWGHVNPIGPRSVYDEAKRFAEALTMAHQRARGVDAGIVRIFNTYGPRLRPDDGRAVSNFIAQALTGAPLTVHGDGRQTRSLCYVDDLVRGLTVMIDRRGVVGPINLGRAEECTVADLAQLILRLTGSSSRIVRGPAPIDDPRRRCPDVGRAAAELGWAPTVTLADGLRETIRWFQGRVDGP